MLLDFFKECLTVLSRRAELVVVLNGLFFSSIFVSALAVSFFFAPPLMEEAAVPSQLSENLVLTFISIFIFNMVLSAFLVIALPGLVFFALSSVLLLYRGVLWGFLVAFASVDWFLVSLPTMVLEGEAYVLAAVSGTIMGLSWLKPSWVFKGEKLPRRKALTMAFKEFICLFFWVFVFLFVSAVVETLTLALV